MNRKNVRAANAAFRKSALPAALLSATLLSACATQRSPQITYDSGVPPLPPVPAALTDERPRPLHIPPAWTPSHGGAAANSPTARVANANAAARVAPRREGSYNAIQIYPWSEGALYQVYTAPAPATNRSIIPPIVQLQTGLQDCRATTPGRASDRLCRVTWAARSSTPRIVDSRSCHHPSSRPSMRRSSAGSPKRRQRARAASSSRHRHGRLRL